MNIFIKSILITYIGITQLRQSNYRSNSFQKFFCQISQYETISSPVSFIHAPDMSNKIKENAFVLILKKSNKWCTIIHVHYMDMDSVEYLIFVGFRYRKNSDDVVRQDKLWLLRNCYSFCNFNIATYSPVTFLKRLLISHV